MTKLLLLLAAAALMAGPAAMSAQVGVTVRPEAQPSAPPAVTDKAERAATPRIKASKIILVGDSTTQVGSGWGGAFCADHVSSSVACVNLGRGGRSTFSYIAEGSWDLALAEMKTPGFGKTYVLIQFGHNDQPGKAGRSTDLAQEFPDLLRRYVSETRAAGAIPVLVTPLTRRSFRQGSLQDDLEPRAAAVRAVAREMNAPLVDLHAASAAAVQAMGAQAATELAQAPPPAEVFAGARTGTTIEAPKTPAAANVVEGVTSDLKPAVITFDYTHLGAKGAALFSAQVAAGLAKAVPELARSLIR